MTPITITTLTPANVRQNLQGDGLDALGLATLSLSPRWSNTTPLIGDYNSNNLTLNISDLRAPFRGIREFAFPPAASTLGADLGDSESDTTLLLAHNSGGYFPNPVNGNVLLTISSVAGKNEIVACTARSEDSLTITRAARGTARQSFEVGDQVTLRLTAGTRTDAFYGVDGNPLTEACTILRLHPQAVLRLQTLAAGRYAALGTPAILPIPRALVVRGVQGFNTPQWLEPDEAMGISGPISFHDGRGFIIDPIYVAALFADLQAFLPGLVGQNPNGPANGPGGVQSIAGLATGTLVHCLDLHGAVHQPAISNATLVINGTEIPSSGLVTLTSGDGIDAAAGDAGRLRWGWLTNGILGREKLVPPALPVTLGRQFYQVAVVDTVWALLGNRTDSVALGIPESDILPAVRDNIVIKYLVDGPDVLGASAAVLARPSQNMILAVSPVLDGTMSVPNLPGPAAHWPVFPPTNTGAGFLATQGSPTAGLTAAFTSGNDVVVTVAADTVPDGAHIRIYPQQFVIIPAITAEPSFLRADGGAAIASAGNETKVLLANPFNLVGGQDKPNHLVMDIVVAPRLGTRKLFAAVTVMVAAGPAAPPADPFAGGNLVGAMLAGPVMFTSVAPAPLFGIPNTVVPPAIAPTGIIGFLRALASETSPRQGPRLPTMARFETILVTGTTGGTPNGTLLWEAVLSGGRWAPETRSALQASGNPGNPAGPDLHAPGIHVSGALAYDLARHAIRRAQPIIPLGEGNPGWIVAMGGDNFNVPQDNYTINTGIGVLLETVAAYCETPELILLPTPEPDANVLTINNEWANIDLTLMPRLANEVRREFVVSKNGLRDALWSLRRVLQEARELIYIESPQFAKTGAVDLVSKIEESLGNHTNLKVIICTPRESDFAPKYKGWSRQHFKARKEAISRLLKAAPGRVAAFHPVGFPGRTAFIRTTTIIVDDVWCMVGATHCRRRGMTFDGSAAVASFDRQMDNGYSRQVRAFRQALMAAKLDVQPPPGTASPSSAWIRLGHTDAAFQLVNDMLSQGGLGKIQPLWSGPEDSSIQTATENMADPEGLPDNSNGETFVLTFASLLAEAGD